MQRGNRLEGRKKKIRPGERLLRAGYFGEMKNARKVPLGGDADADASARSTGEESGE